MSFLDAFTSRLRPVDDEMDDDDIEQDGYEDEDDEDIAPRSRKFSFGRKLTGNSNNSEPEDNFDSGDRIPSRRQGGMRKGSDTMQVRIIKPSSYDQTKLIADTLLENRTVLLNLEGLDVNTAQRIVDFSTGACYALHGNFTQMSHFIFVITPQDVGISGDINSGANAFKSAKTAAAMAAAATANPGMNGNPNPYVQNMNGNPYVQE